MSEMKELPLALRSYRQHDDDGVMVIVSREACDLAADAIERLRAENAQLRSSLDAMVKHVSNEELAREIEARAAAIRARGGK